MGGQTATKASGSQQLTGADAVIAVLKRQGVDVVFGMIGGAIIPVYDALYRDGTIKHIIVGHEQGATHMAEGYARATGRPGVVLATSGPGATNLVTGLADAYMDSIPLVAITGQVNLDLIGNDAFQEAFMSGITMPITKHNYQVTNTDELPGIVAEAFHVAQSGRPGPVLIDLPKDIGMGPCEPLRATQPSLGYKPPFKGHSGQIRRALELLSQAKQPVVIAGGGVVSGEASGALREFARTWQLPVTTSLMGLGAYPADDALSLGMLGMHGTGYANLAIHESDLLVVVGSRLDDRITGQREKFAPRAKLIHVDVDASEIGKILACDVPIVGHSRPVLEAFLKEGTDRERPDLSGWHTRIADMKSCYPVKYRTAEGVIAAPMVIEELGRQLDPDAVVATGVGQHQMFTALFFPFRQPRTCITSGGLGTMGYGLPAAIGAKLACPDRTVACIDGDGSFLMNIQELATAVRYRVPVVVTVLNNGYLGMVKQWQELFFDNRLAESKTAPPPYDKVAQAFGALGRRVERPDELSEAISWALRESKKAQVPAVLDVHCDSTVNVFPMVPPGAANAEFIPEQQCQDN
jgi:acetolactate synthase-1/2/3 large subunit